MKILRIITSCKPEDGGPINGIRQISNILSKLGHETEIACIDNPNSKWLKDFPIKVHALGPGFSHYQYSRKFLNWLKKNAQNYDCVIVHGLWQYDSYAVWEALRKTKVAYFVYPHGMLDPWFNKKYPVKTLLKKMYWFFDQRKVLRDAKAVIFTSGEEKNLAGKSFSPYKCNEVVLPYGIATPKEIRNLFLMRFPELRNKKLILYLGRIHEKKGIDLLIKAFSKIHEKDDSVNLVIAGPDQGLCSKLTQLAEALGVSDKVMWTGMLSGPLKQNALDSADALILPSHQENFGMSVVEALGSGRPVLITNKVNIWREIKKYHAGFVENDDLDGITGLLNKWLRASDNEKRKMRQNARQCFDENFEINKAAKSLIEFLKENIHKEE
jgi:glycosyltransferase involved in cell wall biosynthesis